MISKRGRRGEPYFWRRWSRWCRGASCARWSSRIIPSLGTGGGRWEWSACCGFTFCSSGSTCRTRRWKRRCTTQGGCGSSWALIWAVSRCRTRPRCASSGTCWKNTNWGEQILGQVNLHLQAQGVRITTGTIVDATILHAPTSTKNREQQRDPEMPQTKKGKQWYFGMKAHVGVDSKTKIIHTAVATAANVADSAVLPDLLHGEETRVWGDQAYRGQSEVIRECAPQAQDCTHRRYRYKDGVDEVERARNRTKSRVRSKVEHVFAVMKLKFGFVKLRFRGLKKNATQLFAVCALVNLYLARKKLLLLAPA